MRIHTRIMGAALVVAAALCVTFLTYSLKKEQDTAHAQLHATMEQTRQLLQATIAGPLYDGNIAQLNAHLDSFFKNPDLVEIYLSEYGGDIRLSRAREVAGSDANRLRSVTPIPRGLDQIGEIQTVFTTARIEQRLADSRNQMLLFTAALLAGLAIVIYVAARSLTRPIDRLTEAARAMSAGDLERHIDPGNTQELVVLGESFARMRDVIREKIADLAAKNRLLNQEVDERMRAQEELQRAYGENRAVTQAVHDNLFMTNPAGELVWWNRRVEETTGQSAEQLRGQPGVCFFHEDDREAVGRALMQAAATGFAKVEARLLTASGVVEYQFNGVRVLDERGQLVGIAGSGRDISERVRGERVLRENEAKYRALADNIPQRVFYKDRQSRYLAVNHHYAHDLGLNPEDFIGKDDHALHPTDIAARYQRDDQRVMDTGQALEADESYVRGGNEFMIHTVKTPVWDETGAVIGVCGIFFDVTEQRVLERRLQDSEATLRAIYENAPDGILVSSIDADRIWMANPGICRMTGYSEAELLALRPLDLHPAHVGAQVARAFSSLREGTFSPGKDLLMQRKDGSTFFADVSPAPVTVRGQPCFIAIFRDVTERRLVADAMRHLNEDLEARVQRRTEQLALSRDEAKRANEAKSAFLSRMSHELRTPLNAILGFAQLLVRDKLPVEQADNAREIVHAGRHLLDLINEVLDLARIESGKFTVSLEPLPLLPLLEDCMALIRPQADARAISMTVRSPDRRQQVQADRTRLKQVLLNLLSNAVKYNRQGGAVHVHCVSEEDTLQIRVTDTGTGLSAEQQLRLFVPFERLDAERTAVEGAGIGLALSKRLVEHMQGQIGVQSAPGAGSTFWVRLPLSGRQAEVSGPTPLAADDGMRWPVPARKQDVLCIEDNPANLRLIERILARDQGIRLLTASQPGLGLELARAHQPAMILLDINLPDMDGYAVMQCLRESPLTRDIPVVAISANAMPSDLERGRAAGFVDYLTKPLDIEHLMAVTHRILDIDRSPT